MRNPFEDLRIRGLKWPSKHVGKLNEGSRCDISSLSKKSEYPWRCLGLILKILVLFLASRWQPATATVNEAKGARNGAEN